MLFPVLAPANILTGFIGLVLLSTKDHITGWRRKILWIGQRKELVNLVYWLT
jgi:hypothetical protein